MTEPIYTDEDLAAADAELAEASEDPGPDVADTEADQPLDPASDAEEEETTP